MSEWIIDFDDDSVNRLKRNLLISDMTDKDNPNRPLEVRALVCNLPGKLKIEIFSNEHPPPHFRVKYNEYKANFRISDFEKIDGYIKPRNHEVIREWWAKNKQVLIDKWNERRPSDCPVGEYKEP